jgi:hypothetical protein
LFFEPGVYTSAFVFDITRLIQVMLRSTEEEPSASFDDAVCAELSAGSQAMRIADVAMNNS